MVRWAAAAGGGGGGGSSAAVVGSSIYVIGGRTPSAPTGEASVDVFDAATSAWRNGSTTAQASDDGGDATSGAEAAAAVGSSIPPMPTARYNLAVAVDASGRVLALGGYRGATGTYTGALEIFSPGSSTWATATPMPSARSLLVAGVLGRLVVVMTCCNKDLVA